MSPLFDLSRAFHAVAAGGGDGGGGGGGKLKLITSFRVGRPS